MKKKLEELSLKETLEFIKQATHLMAHPDKTEEINQFLENFELEDEIKFGED